MHYGAPLYLYGLILVPIAFALFWRGRARRNEALARFGESRLLEFLKLDADEGKRRRKERLILFALAGVLFALAHPQYGEKRTEVKREGVDVVFLLDTSLSMLAEDMKPNRLAHAKREIEGFLSRLRGDRIGIVSFAGTAVPTCPLTIDYGAVRMFLRGVDTWTAPEAGTAIAKAIERGTRMLVESGSGSRVLVLMTDGEDHEGDVARAARLAADEGIRVFSIGFGTADGELIPVNSREFKKDNAGEFVVTRRIDKSLREAATVSDGRYWSMSEQPDALDLVYDTLQGMEKQEYKSRIAVVREERFAWFLFPAAVLLVIESLLSTVTRRKEVWAGRVAP